MPRAHPDGMAAMGDDCEKFGSWPSTYEHCYGDGWLDQLFHCHGNAARLAGNRLRRASIWPPRAAGPRRSAHRVLHRNDGVGVCPRARANNFTPWRANLPRGRTCAALSARRHLARISSAKYSESNLLHKKMLQRLRRASQRARGPGRERRRAELDAGAHACCCARNATMPTGTAFSAASTRRICARELWRELVRAEALARQLEALDEGIRVERTRLRRRRPRGALRPSRRMAALVSPPTAARSPPRFPRPGSR